MPDNSQLPSPSNKPPAPSKSNKKRWVVLGSMVCVMLLMMGGCAGPSRSDYVPTSSNSSSNSAASSVNAPETPSGAGTATGRTGGLAGTWKGNLKCSNGQTLPSVYKVAGSGNPIYEYQTNNGPREAELTSSGQTVRFIPPEGGVVTAVVNSLSTSSDRISFQMDITGEKTSGGTLDQSEAGVTMDAKLSGAELEVEMAIRSTSVASQPDLVVPGKESSGVCSGRLRKE